MTRPIRQSAAWVSAATVMVAVLALAAAAADVAADTAADEPALTREQIEADWIVQAQVRSRGPGGAVRTCDDAAGACDGRKDGKWGFHTDAEANPWWHVDLGEVRPLARVLVFNRCDGGSAGRAARLVLLLSDDGRAWREAYRHDGSVFQGVPDGKPLAVGLDGARARFVRLQLHATGYFHLDEVEVYGPEDPSRNLALGCAADQSSVSQWSTRKAPAAGAASYPVAETLERGRRLAADLRGTGADVEAGLRALGAAERALGALPADAPAEDRRAPYLEARWAVRRLALANPLLDFDAVVFAKQVPGSYSHMSDQYYGWWSRPGGGIYVLEGFKGDRPRLRCLTAGMAAGSFLRPDLAFDGRRVLFAYARHYPHLASVRDKTAKDRLPEDGFYHVYEVNVDGTGLRRLTRGRYDDFDARYLPSGDIVLLSTRRGQFVQCTPASAARTLEATLPDSYVRCGGGDSRPVAVYTLHVMDADGRRLRAISPFENFEWTPSVGRDGRVLYARWDYVDRDNMPYMKLWATTPDGTNPQAVFGNFTRNPHCTFEARSVPGSHKIVFTASGHHSITGGSLVLLDPSLGLDGADPMRRLTPEVCFPESEGWPATYYASPYPLSETYYLTAWSPVGLNREGGPNPPNALGLYLFDAFGHLEPIYRDPNISSHCPLPLRARPAPPVVTSAVAWDGPQEGRVAVQNVYEGLAGLPRGAVRRLRVVAVPAKVQPQMNTPVLGVTRDDPGKCVLGTVPVDPDGSAHFRVPSGVPLFFQALDARGMAVQTMRTVTYVQPGQTLTCVGCHERRDTAPPASRPTAVGRAPSRLTPGPDGSWPLRFDRLVQPVLDRTCTGCHRPGGPDPKAARLDLTSQRAYESLVKAGGKEGLYERVRARYYEGRSRPGDAEAANSAVLRVLAEGPQHRDVRLGAEALERLVTWMDTYAQHLGSFGPEQEAHLVALRREWDDLLEPREGGE